MICKHCGAEIINIGSPTDPDWRHYDNGHTFRMCFEISSTVAEPDDD